MLSSAREVTDMDFFERWFGLAPDDGSGVTEALWIGAIVVAVLVVAYRRRVRAWLASRSFGRG